MLQIETKSISEAITKIKREYSHISGDVLNQAISRGLNHTASKTKTKSNGSIRQIFNIGASKINNELKVRYSQSRTLHAEIKASGVPLSLNMFQAKQEGERSTTSFSRKGVASSRLNRKARSNAIKGVSFEIKKGNKQNLPTAFIQAANGGITVFARGKAKGKGQGFEFAKARLPIGKITTTSVPLMFANNDVMQPSMKYAESLLTDRIVHEINWLLSK